MEVDLLMDVVKDPVCPSIKIEPIGDVSLPMASSQEDNAAEEKNDSGIRWGKLQGRGYDGIC